MIRIVKHGSPNDLPSWRERIATLQYVPQFIKLVWQTGRCLMLTMLTLRLLLAVSPVVLLWIGKLIIDTVVEATRTPSAGFGRLWELIALEAALVLVNAAISRTSSLVESLLGGLFFNNISIRVMEHAATLDLYRFEDPTFYNKLNRARGEMTGRIMMLVNLLRMCQDALTFFSISTVLFL